MPEKKILELLSPAKNAESGIIALNFGADAVYTGAPKFGARTAAANSIYDIEKLCKYAHKFNSKVYVTLNTILYENELEEAQKIIRQIYNSGADALIIQDFGILEMNLPPIQIHASTQAHNISAEKLIFYEKLGITRAVLARETSLKQIKEISAQTKIELEAFVHGSLCVSYSGQCYMSAYIGNRSGNRGECAQSCRLKYNLLDTEKNIIEENKNILSIKDMNRASYIAQTAEAGITSFKIEGRLKDTDYVKNITAFYRKALDSVILENKKYLTGNSRFFIFDFEPDPEKTFNRGYTDYFLNGRTEDISSHTPKSIGKAVGKVLKPQTNFFTINSQTEIKTGDGLCYFNENNELCGFSVNKVEGDKIFTDSELNLKPETTIFRNFDIKFTKKINEISNSGYLNINFFLEETQTGIKLTAETEDKNYSVSKNYQTKKEKAKNTEKFEEIIKIQLSKTGGTIFKVKNIEIKFKEALFLPASLINEIRRTTLSLLYENLGTKYLRSEKNLTKNEIVFFDKNLDYMNNISNTLSEKFHKKHGAVNIEKAFELTENKSNKTLMTTKHCIKYNLGICPKYHKINEKNNKPEPKYLQLNDKIFKLEFDCNNCVMKIISS